MISKKRERRMKSFSDSVMWSRDSGQAPASLDKGYPSPSLPYWSKSFGWSRSRSLKERNIKASRSSSKRFSIIEHPIIIRGRKDRYGAEYAW